MQIFRDQKALDELCKRHHIRRLALFGSTLKGTARPTSDIDLLVEFEPGVAVGLFQVIAAEQDLTDMLGKKVDLRTKEDLSRHFRDEVVRMAEVQYAA
jgi:predicted nucleotidyltransferase